MTELLTGAQMRAIEQAAIESGEVTGLELMERAGQGVLEAIFEEWPEYQTAPQSVVVLCGPGNNGGDGFVVARRLKALNWDVRVLFLGTAEKLPADARTNFDIWCADNPVEALTEKALRRLPAALYVDAIFGSGLKRPLDGEALAVISHMSGRTGDNYFLQTIAIDAPSGLCLDSGKFLASGMVLGINPLAKICVTFDSPKAGHFLDLGPIACGKIVIKDIGLRKWRERATRRPLALVGPKALVKDNRPFLSRNMNVFLGKEKWVSQPNKFDFGHALFLSGGSGQTGAARLACRAALRLGVGLVTIGCPPSAKLECAATLTAIMVSSLKDIAAFEAKLEDKRISALCLGPGMGLTKRTRDFVATALKSGRPCVLDADALTVFENNPDELFEMLHSNCVLTPHGGEFRRLFPDIQDKLTAPAGIGPAYSKVDATREAAKRAGCTVLYKGADTVIADQLGSAAIHASHYDRKAPWLATAGSGDVLAGLITGLLARSTFPMLAAQIGAWIHTECALSFGSGLISEDLPEELPKVLRALGL